MSPEELEQLLGPCGSDKVISPEGWQRLQDWLKSKNAKWTPVRQDD